MSTEAPKFKVDVEVAGSLISLDPDNMRFNENNLANYMNREYGWIDYLGKQLEFAQKELLIVEMQADAIFNKKFLEAKDNGKTDSYSKSYAGAHEEYLDAKKSIIDKKQVVGLLKAHLRAWDKNHENVQNRGHTLRKEMDALSREVYPTDKDNIKVNSSIESYLGAIE